MKKDKKRIIGIVMLVIGVLGLFGVPSSDDKGTLIAGSLVFIAIGGVLLFLSVKAKKNATNMPYDASAAHQIKNSPSPMLQPAPVFQTDAKGDTNNKNVEPDYKKLNSDEVIEKYISTDHTDCPSSFKFSHYKIAEFKCILYSVKRVRVEADLSINRKKRVATDFGYYSTTKLNKNTVFSELGRFIVIDTETTGLSPKNNKIIELSAIKFDRFRPIEMFSTYLDPKKHIPNAVTEITGIDDELIQGSPTYAQIQESFEEYIKDYNLVFHNARFDLAFLHYSGTSIDTDNQQVFDTLELAKKHLKDTDGIKYSSYSLEMACAYRNINIANSHSSEADALATGLLFNEIIKEVSGKNNLNKLLDT